jgi:ABC-type branched-subunit amino acid transport system ATPase component
MNIIYYLLNEFFQEEKQNTIFMIIISFIINIFQTNIISYLTANIIFFIQKSNKPIVYLYFIYFVVISIIYILLYNFYKYFQNKILTKLRQWIKFQLIKMILLINNENFSNINFNKLSSPINRIASVCFMVFTDIITFLLPNITFLIIIALYFLYKNIVFGTTFILGNIIIFLYLYLNWENMMEFNENYEKYVNENESYLLEILNNIDKIIYRGQVNTEIDIFGKKSEKAIEHAFEFYSNTNYHGVIMNMIMYIILFISVYYLIVLYFEKKISLTIFITFFTILLLYRDKMNTIIQQVPDFIEFLGRSESVLKHFRNMETDYLKIIEKDISIMNNPEMEFKTIYFDKISFKYNERDKNSVFDNFSLKMNIDNKIIGITGLSGNGKSTLSKMILKLYRPTTGVIYIDDQNIEDIDTDYLRQNITYVNQNSKLFDRKIIENIHYACNQKEYCDEKLTEIMKYPKIAELFRNMDIHTKDAGSLGANVSGGQSMIINIISGLINPSKILILDEPTNALDSDLKKELIGIIKDFKKYKQTIIIITHDKDCYRLFNETVKI